MNKKNFKCLTPKSVILENEHEDNDKTLMYR